MVSNFDWLLALKYYTARA